MRQKVPLWCQAALAAGASGGLMAACFWPLNLHFLAWVALVPWLLVLPRLGPWSSWLWGTLLGLVFYRFGLDWLFNLYGFIGGIVIIAMAVLVGFSFRVARMLMGYLGPAAMLWAAPLAFAAQEAMRSEGLRLCRFSHLVLGYSQAGNPALAQIASIGGVFLVSFLIVAFNAAVAYALLARRPKAWLAALGVAALTVGLAALGQPRPYDTLPRVPVAAVQEESPLLDKFEDWTAQAAADPHGPKFIVLPEHTIMDFGPDDERLPLLDRLEKIARDHAAYICLGTHTQPPPLDYKDPRQRQLAMKRCWYNNVALVIGPRGRIVHKQLKTVPVPFYEDGNPAAGQATFPTDFGRVGAYVCYDESFGDVMRHFADQGAELLLGPVFNRKDWPLQQRMQQADMIPFRAIELRRCMVRAASSGVSQIIDATGRVQARRLQADGSGLLLGTVYFNNERTIFAAGGWLFAPVVAWAFIAAVVLMTLAEWFRALRATRRFIRARISPLPRKE